MPALVSADNETLSLLIFISRPATSALALQLAAASATCFLSSAHLHAGAGDLFASDTTANTIRIYALDGIDPTESARILIRALGKSLEQATVPVRTPPCRIRRSSCTTATAT